MDISKFAIASGSMKMELRDPNTNVVLRDKKGKALITFDLLSVESSEFKKVERKQRDKFLKMQSLNRGKIKLSSDELDEDQFTKISSCVLGWSGMELNGKDLNYDKSNVRKILTEDEFGWIKDQIVDYIEERENFTKAS